MSETPAPYAAYAEYSKWANENPDCCEYCFDEWLNNQENAEKEARDQ